MRYVKKVGEALFLWEEVGNKTGKGLKYADNKENH